MARERNPVYAADMIQRVFPLSRRRALCLLGLTALPALLPVTRSSASDDPEVVLRRSLDAIRFDDPKARLAVLQFSTGSDGAATRMSAVIRMTWTPGMRQYGFTAEAHDTAQTLAILSNRIETRFRAVFQGMV